jgi:hypothetical protein
MPIDESPEGVIEHLRQRREDQASRAFKERLRAYLERLDECHRERERSRKPLTSTPSQPTMGP